MPVVLEFVAFETLDFLNSVLLAAIDSKKNSPPNWGKKESPLEAILLVPYACNFALADYMIFIPKFEVDSHLMFLFQATVNIKTHSPLIML